jgi:hypothetical protein
MTYTRKYRKKKISKKHNKVHMLKNKTPRNIRIISEDIAESLDNAESLDKRSVVGVAQGNKALESYRPTINEMLVSLKSDTREKFTDCNNKKAFKLLEPLQISVSDNMFGTECVPYYGPAAKQQLLKNLSANKHVKTNKIIPPKQIKSNCWFNAMFTTLFVSDKGRQFFHYFRQLMIEGRMANGQSIPNKLRNAFALLNFAIDSALTGSEYAYELDTNNIIKTIYDNIPAKFNKTTPYIVDVDEASNPIKYYMSIIHYLDNKSIELLFVSKISSSSPWRERIMAEMKKVKHVPHVIVLEIFDSNDGDAGDSGKIKNKVKEFTIDSSTYILDSCVVRDIDQQHFCATITCEGKEMGYDGMSFHRLVPMKWSSKLNTNYEWGFDGSTDLDEKPLKWSFTHGYQMLIYYRVK